MKQILILTAVLGLLHLPARPQQPTPLPAPAVEAELCIVPKSVEAGKAATLTWSTKNAKSVLISGIGLVGGSGSREVRPAETTVYTIVAEGDDGHVTQAARLEVVGSRGEDEFPSDFNRFSHPKQFQMPVGSLTTFLDRVYQTIQDGMTLSVTGPHDRSGRFFFVTKKAEKSFLMQPDDRSRRIGRRRVTYLVEVQPGRRAGAATCVIRAWLEYQKTVEEAWRTEDAEALYEAAIGELRPKLERIR